MGYASPWLYNFGSAFKSKSDHGFEISNSLFGGFFPSFFSLRGAEIDGTKRSDIIFGSIFSDKINGRKGDDLIFGLTGDDTIKGGRGDDTIFGGLGDDNIKGGRGDDVINAGKGVNKVDGGKGDADVLVLSGDFDDYAFDFHKDGSFTVTGNGQVTTAKNIELLRDDAGEDTDVTFTLQILHASDLEGGVDAIGRAANFAALIDAFEGEVENSILLSAGDNYIPGPFFNAAGDRSLRDDLQAAYQTLFGEPGLTNIREGNGRIDISIMNILGFDASAVGNHEFDAGPDAFAGLIDADVRTNDADEIQLDTIRWFGAQFPYLSANYDFSGEPALSGLFTDQILNSADYAFDPAEALAGGSQPRIAPATVIEEGGELVGVIGATTQVLDTITSNGGVVANDGSVNTNDMTLLAAVLQPIVDQMTADGINKIVLVSHLQQFALEQELATLLSGVDVIIAGGSDTLLADENDVLRQGDVADDAYPFVATDAAGGSTLIVSTDGEYSYLGRLVLEFDVNGEVIVNALDTDVNGAYATTDAVVNEVYGVSDVANAIAASDKATEVKALTDAVDGIVQAQDGNVFGKTEVFIEGRREQVRTEETNLGNLTADANLDLAQVFDGSVLVSIKNGGGIRSAIGEIDGDTGDLLPTQANPDAGKLAGEISQLDIVNALRFNNGLTLLDLTPQELLDVLNHGVAGSSFDASGEPTNTPGQFPQIAGVRFSFDPALASGGRVQDVIVETASGDVQIASGGALTGQTDLASIRVVTLNFLADGGDGYPFPTGASANRVDLFDLDGNGLDDADDFANGGAFDPFFGEAQFAAFGTEQDALAEYLAANFPNDGRDVADALPSFNTAETDPAQDGRIVNLAVPGADLDGVA